ncbi:MAG TPA: dTDP-4-dehydrorhamnose reductase, partial [Methylophaga sp.]|nr:dTDP-4-dehydrorhamnose reductase [Methylophaga sp.]
MTVLLLGATGQLGTELQQYLAQSKQLLTQGRHKVQYYYDDLRHTKKLIKSLKQIRPNIIVN